MGKITIDTDKLSCYDEVKDKIYAVLVNHDDNRRNILPPQLHMDILDLSVYYRILIDVDGDCRTSIGVSTSMYNTWSKDNPGIPTDLAFHTNAMNNTKKLFPRNVKPINTFLEEHNVKMDDVPMITVTNSDYAYGAIYMLDTNTMIEASNQLGGGPIYILPSSIHDVLAIPADPLFPIEDIFEMVRFTNDTEVDEDERLSYSVYYFDPRIGNLGQIKKGD